MVVDLFMKKKIALISNRLKTAQDSLLWLKSTMSWAISICINLAIIQFSPLMSSWRKCVFVEESGSVIWGETRSMNSKLIYINQSSIIHQMVRISFLVNAGMMASGNFLLGIKLVPKGSNGEIKSFCDRFTKP